jgi:hypothetical protein
LFNYGGDMKQELEEILCKKYPKLLGTESETQLRWGFECGDGWFNILDQLMDSIQWHLQCDINNQQYTIQRNQTIAAAKEAAEQSDYSLVQDMFHHVFDPFEKEERIQEMLTSELDPVKPLLQQVVVRQVKEKFGTLRFYYSGGDDTIDGMVQMAESMSSVTCECCGNPGESAQNDWITTICKSCKGT